MADHTGHYMGTEINGRWWKRYKKDGFFARGKGTYWYDEKAFYFLKYLADDPMVIPLEDITDIKLGTWHAGQWGAGAPVLKIIWEKDSLLLSSGFLLSKKREEVEAMISDLQKGYLRCH